jgi:transcriptional regulator with XRE-family HTH domain
MDRYLNGHYTQAYIPGMTTLPERLDKAMTRRDGSKMSQSELARRSKVSQPSINRILKGISLTPDLQTLQKLSSALGVDFEWLANDAGEAPNSSNRGQKAVLSEEADRLIQCVMRLDKGGAKVRQTFAYTLGILEIVERLGLVHDADVVAELAEQEQILALHAEPSRVLKHAPRKHK